MKHKYINNTFENDDFASRPHVVARWIVGFPVSFAIQLSLLLVCVDGV